MSIAALAIRLTAYGSKIYQDNSLLVLLLNIKYQQHGQEGEAFTSSQARKVISPRAK